MVNNLFNHGSFFNHPASGPHHFDTEIGVTLIQNALNIKSSSDTQKAIDRGIAILNCKTSIFTNIANDIRMTWSAETSENKWIAFFQTIGKILVIIKRVFSGQSMQLKEYGIYKKLAKDVSNFGSIFYYLIQKKLTGQQCLQTRLVKIAQVPFGERMVMQTRLKEMIHLLPEIKTTFDYILKFLETKNSHNDTNRFDLCLAFLYQITTFIQHTSEEIEKTVYIDWMTQCAQSIFGIFHEADPLINDRQTIKISARQSIEYRQILEAARVVHEMHPSEEDFIPLPLFQAAMNRVSNAHIKSN